MESEFEPGWAGVSRETSTGRNALETHRHATRYGSSQAVNAGAAVDWGQTQPARRARSSPNMAHEPGTRRIQPGPRPSVGTACRATVGARRGGDSDPQRNDTDLHLGRACSMADGNHRLHARRARQRRKAAPSNRGDSETPETTGSRRALTRSCVGSVHGQVRGHGRVRRRPHRTIVVDPASPIGPTTWRGRPGFGQSATTGTPPRGPSRILLRHGPQPRSEQDPAENAGRARAQGDRRCRWEPGRRATVDVAGSPGSGAATDPGSTANTVGLHPYIQPQQSPPDARPWTIFRPAAVSSSATQSSRPASDTRFSPPSSIGATGPASCKPPGRHAQRAGSCTDTASTPGTRRIQPEPRRDTRARCPWPPGALVLADAAHSGSVRSRGRRASVPSHHQL